MNNEVLSENVFKRILLEYSKKQKSLAGSHPDESYVYGWPQIEAELFDMPGLTTWEEDRIWTREYLEAMGLM